MATKEPPDQDPLAAVSAADAEKALLAFGVAGTARPLCGYCDRNFRIDGPKGPTHVLKFCNPDTDREEVRFQDLALRHLAQQGVAGCPVPVDPLPGFPLDVPLPSGGQSRVRLLTWVPGRPLAEVRPRTDALLREIGRHLAGIDRSLAELPGTGGTRGPSFRWDLDRAGEVVGEHLPVDADLELRTWVGPALTQWPALKSTLASLPTAPIHGDGNDWNILVTQPWAGPPRMTGVIDFGDLHRSVRTAGPAIAAAYLMLETADPVSAAAAFLEGWQDVYPLTEAEVESLPDLIRWRLLVSVTLSTQKRLSGRDDPYSSISEVPARALLRMLDQLPARWFRARLRQAAGFEPCPAGGHLSRWLTQAAPSAYPLLGRALGPRDITIVDLSVEAPPFCEGFPPEEAGRAVARLMEDAGASVGIGRYGEVRSCYESPIFLGDPDPDRLGERRTVHLGVDLFVGAGTPLFAPFDGVIWTATDNANPLDYGPTLIIEATSDEGPFWILLGHLDRGSIAGWKPGQAFRRGDRLAAVGHHTENGGWAPHVHVQVIADILDLRTGDFPGVARPKDRAAWMSVCPDPGPLLGLAGATAVPDSLARHPDALIALRKRHLPQNLSLSYRNPLTMVRGRGPHLIDVDGQPYLDGVNNVCHVGHAHPRVVRAESRQAATLNTNTRYLHPLLGTYVERLARLFPDPLSVVFLCSSGSEANETALRLARKATGRRDFVVLQAGYHGHTGSLVDLSDYKHAGPGGDGAPPWVHVAPLPDAFRGRHRGPPEDVSDLYAQDVAQMLQGMTDAGHPCAAFLAETLPGCGGQIVLPPGYLAQVYAAVRASGGVCIADEVQVGFGRVGTHWWAFEAEGVVPDIVTVGKPMGNGHPLAAVITTPAIAAAFHTGMEWFSTFGGNPVSCAVGHAVLDVVEDEGLRDRAARVGAQVYSGLRDLMEAHPHVIGDVRGRGLYLGMECIQAGSDREPDAAAAAWIVHRCRELGVLLSTDGPDHNVIKIKPPMVWTEHHGATLLQTLATVLSESALELRG